MSDLDDLVHERRCQLEFGLPLFMDFWPDRIPRDRPHLLTSFLSTHLERLARCYWLGLADEVRPRIEAMIDWMSSRDPDDFKPRTDHPRGELVVFEAREWWWQILGLSKWLAGNDASTDDLTIALFANWDRRQFLEGSRHAVDRAGYGAFISRTLALALAAKRPEIGAHLYGLAEDNDPPSEDLFKVEYGRWACVHLAHGGKRDGDYVLSGIRVLAQEALDRSLFGASAEHLLWLKAIWFDTGLATTAEDAVFREYDVTGSLKRPEFAPRRRTFL